MRYRAAQTDGFALCHGRFSPTLDAVPEERRLAAGCNLITPATIRRALKAPGFAIRKEESHVFHRHPRHSFPSHNSDVSRRSRGDRAGGSVRPRGRVRACRACEGRRRQHRHDRRTADARSDGVDRRPGRHNHATRVRTAVHVRRQLERDTHAGGEHAGDLEGRPGLYDPTAQRRQVP